MYLEIIYRPTIIEDIWKVYMWYLSMNTLQGTSDFLCDFLDFFFLKEKKKWMISNINANSEN